MSRVKSLIHIISACEKHEFDKIVKSYIKEIFGYKRVVNTDGKDDTGIDIKVFDLANEKAQYQLTIQKSDTAKYKASLKNKIFEDVEKAKENYEKYGYSNKLYFFYSHELTNKIKREYVREALSNFDIILEIIDANQIAEEAEDVLILQESIYKICGFEDLKSQDSPFEDKNKNLIYDLISFGETSDIKLDIVEAYILQCLFVQDAMTLEDISKSCMDKFSSKENPTFYTKLTKKLYSNENKLLYNKITKKYSLSQSVRSQIEQQNEQIRLDEQFFLNEIDKILKIYNEQSFLHEYVKELQCIYIKNIERRVQSSSSIDNVDVTPLLDLAKKRLCKEQTHSMVSELIKVCDANKYLQKICASYVFSSKIKIDDLQRYANEKKSLYIDTTIALYLLCYFYNTTSKYEQYYYTLSKSLLEFCNRNRITLHIVERYIWEIASHIQEAFNLIPFTQLPNFHLLGRSNNVFYNFYCFLKDSNEYDGSFEAFLKEYNFPIDKDALNDKIKFFLKELGIEVVPLNKRYNIENVSKLIGIFMSENNRYKTPFALSNDAIMVEFLADSDVDIHPIDPVFLTWDRTLFAILNDFFKRRSTAHRWMQFTPSQFIDRYSLLSFSIDSETISKEILAVLSDDIVQHTYSLIDSLALILNPKNEIGLKYTNEIMKMKDEKIYTTSKDSDEPSDNKDNHAIENIIYNITTHYRSEDKKYDALKKLFLTDELMDEVLKILMDSIQSFNLKKHFDSTTIDKLDELIERTYKESSFLHKK